MRFQNALRAPSRYCRGVESYETTMRAGAGFLDLPQPKPVLTSFFSN
jgi:hypothetical protein